MSALEVILLSLVFVQSAGLLVSYAGHLGRSRSLEDLINDLDRQLDSINQRLFEIHERLKR